ncbi:hypothetical protein [Stenotrophomonas sp. ESTM1D_MKCIP4_1]|uniref:hypothetical protein n=1 Tax=Stenotrophomonas sp. ESTM1D_MKCIP4_1 TaxID=2072414 RepID=UPI00131F1E29|nr:hypothetical protein [Stenotrophomonas sp. ESTM1D_MKCIP4_1]
MKLSPSVVVLSLLVLGAGMSEASDAYAAPSRSPCTTTETSTILRRGDAGFKETTASLNRFFDAHRATAVISTPPRRELADAEAEVIHVETHVERCGKGSLLDTHTNSIGGCSYVGCTGSPGHEFSGMPVGSVVSMSSCGGGMQRSGTFQRTASGWVMTAYKEARATQCDALS